MKTERIQRILNRVTDGTAIDSDVGLLFLWLRDFCNPIGSEEDRQLWDLACYISHNQERNQGESHRRLAKVLKQLVRASEKTGSLGFGQPVFLKEELVEMLIKKMEIISLQVDQELVRLKRDFIADSMMNLIEGTEFIEGKGDMSLELLRPKFVSARLVRSGEKVVYDVRLNLPEGFFTVDPSCPLLFPLFN